MVKSYLRYSQEKTFGVISSPQTNVIYDATGKLAITGSLENVAVWNIRQGTLVNLLKGESGGEVSCLASSPDKTHIAAGYTNGTIRVFNLVKAQLAVTFNGHKSCVGSLSYSEDGALLASGSRDTDIIVWDIVAETGLYRLRGHKDEVTSLAFMKSATLLVSGSKDTLLKVWDLQTQHCAQTVVGHRCEVWALACNAAHTRIITGAADSRLRIWSVDLEGRGREPICGGGVLTDSSTTPAAAATAEAGSGEGSVGGDAAGAVPEYLSLLGELPRQGQGRCQGINFSADGRLLAVQSVGKLVEVWQVRTEAEARKRMARRLRRQREKERAKLEAGGEATDAAAAAADPATAAPTPPLPTDELELSCGVRVTSPVRSATFSPEGGKDGSRQLLLGLHNNSVEVYKVGGGVETKKGAGGGGDHEAGGGCVVGGASE